MVLNYTLLCYFNKTHAYYVFLQLKIIFLPITQREYNVATTWSFIAKLLKLQTTVSSAKGPSCTLFETSSNNDIALKGEDLLKLKYN